MKTRTGKRLLRILFSLSILLCIGFSADAQCTALGPGDLVFTGYNQLDDGTNGAVDDDSFSFLLLKDVPAGQQIFFTDLGWTSAGTFQTAQNAPSDGIIRWTADVDYRAGTEIIVYCKYTLLAKDINGAARGTVTGIQKTFNTTSTNPAEYLSLAEFSGDQVFAFTGTTSSPVFLAGISMNRAPGAQWEATLPANGFGADKSVLPPALSAAGFNVGISRIDPDDPFFNSGPVARYNRTNPANLTGAPAQLRTTINTAANWEFRIDGNPYAPLLATGTFTATGVSITNQPVSRTNLCLGSATSFTVAALDACAYQWEESTDGVIFTPVSNTGVYTNATTATLNISNVTTLANRKYRVKVSGIAGMTSDIVNLTLLNPTIVLSPATLPAAIPNLAYSQTITATGGTGTYTYTIVSGTTPTGTSLNSAGVLSGTPTVPASYTFTVQVADNCSTPNTATQQYTLLVGTLDQTITLTDASKTYGDPTFTLPLNSSAGLPVTYISATPAVATVTGNVVTIVGAGSTEITATQAGDASYNPAIPVAKTITVAPKAITVTATAGTKVYGQPEPILTQAITTGGALVTGDNFSGSVTRAPGENAGTYVISKGTLSAGSNYTLTFVSADFTITAAPLTLTLNDVPLITKVYDNTTTATLQASNYNLAGIVNNDAVTVTGIAAYNNEDAGTGKTITANTFVLAGALKDNYSLSTVTATTTGEITALPITLTLNATPLITRTYDNTTTATLDPTNYVLSGVLPTDVVTVSGTADYDTKGAGTGKTITANTFVLAGAQKDNYSLTTTTATTTGNITTAPLTLALNATPLITKIYDNTTAATLAATNYDLSGILGTDVVTVSGTANYDTNAAGNGKTITVDNFTLSGAQKNNYSLSMLSATTTGNITALPVTLTLNATPSITKTYDNTTAATLVPANYNLSGILGTDVVTVSGTANYDTNTAGTGKTITANTFALAGAQKDNYSLTTTTATTVGDITTAPLIVALNATPLISKIYDNNTTATLAAQNYDLTGLLGSDEVSVSGAANYDNAQVGTGKTITVNTFALAGAQKDNYNLTTTTASTTGNITAAPLTLTLNATPLISKVYDNADVATLTATNYSLSGVLTPDEVTVTGVATYDNKDAGTNKTITVTNFVLAGAEKDNYSLTTTTANTTGNITTAPLTLALNATPLINKVYDNNTAATLTPANYTLTGIQGSNAVTVSGTANYDTNAAGTGKTITADNFVLDGADKNNYALSTTTATTTGNITTKAITLALVATPVISKTYNNTTVATLATGNYDLAGVLGSDEVTISGTATYDTKTVGTGKTITAGSFALAGAQKDNYALSTTTATTTGNITAAGLTLALNATPLIDKVYDNNTTAALAPANYTLTGIQGSDAVTVSGTANYDTKDAGTGKTVTANTFVLDGADKDNYTLGTIAVITTGNITAKPITLALNATPVISKIYDNNAGATLAANNYSLTGLLGSDEVSVSGAANYDNAQVGTGKTITANTFALAGAQKDNYNLTTTTATTTGNINAATLTLTLNATPLINKVYDNNTVATLAPANYSLNGIVGADEVSATGTANYNTKDAGTGKTINAGSFVLAGAQKDNYTLSTTTAITTGNITAAPLTLALNATPLINKVYDNNTVAPLTPANYTLTGIQGSNAVTVSGTANYDTNAAGTGKTITADNFVLNGADKNNYSLTTTTATTTGNITTKAITLALLATPVISKTYNNTTTASLATGNYDLAGILGSDEVTVSGTATYDTKTVGTGKTITAGSFALAGAQKDNYALSTTTATTTGNITAAGLTLALNATPLIDKVYDNNTTAALAPANYTLTGIQGSDGVTVSGTTNYDTKDAGTGKTVTANAFVLDGADKDNYTLGTIAATTTGNITAKPITLALNATPVISKIYDNNAGATLAANNYSLTGLLGSDEVSVSGAANYDNAQVGTGKTITVNTFALAGAQKDNYNLTTTTATTTGNITAATLTLTLNAAPLINKVYDNNTVATLAPANYSLNGIVGADEVSATGTANYNTKDAGTGKTINAGSFVLAGAQKDNYTLSTTTAITTGNITAAPLTLALNATPLINKVYDNNTVAPLTPANYTLIGIQGSNAVTVSGTANYDTNAAGTGKTITADNFVLDGADKNNYSLTTTTATTTGNITTKAITLALLATPVISKTYDNTTVATLATGNYDLAGVLGSDEVTVSGTATYDTKTVGTGKTITAGSFALAGAQKDNYALSTTTASTTGNITAAGLTLALNATPLIDKVYDNNTTAALAPANYTLTGIQGSDAVTVSGTANYDTKDAGTGKTVTANAFVLDGADKDNYTLGTIAATTTGNITAKPITLALNATPVITKPYDNTTSASLATANYTLTGLLGSDVLSVSGTANYDNALAGTGKTITVNAFVLAGAQKDNYNLTTTTATTTGNITLRALTLALNATPLINKVYDNNTVATLAPANYSLTGVLPADEVVVTGTATYADKNAGIGKIITAGSFVLTGAQKDNYTLSTTTATTTGNITTAPLTLALNATPLINKVYDNNTVAPLTPANYTLNGVIGSDVITVSGTANYDNKNAGTGKTITASDFVIAGAQKDNYSLSTVSATTTGNITAVPLTLALNATPLISKVYDNNAFASLTTQNYTLTGLLGSDEVTVSGTATYNNKDVATGKTITASNFALAGAQKDNYTLSTTTATTTGNITAASLTLALNATPLINKVYDNNTVATLTPANYTLNGVIGSDVVSVSGTANYDTKDAGTGKTITAGNFVLAGAQKNNYSLSIVSATTTGNITAKPVTLALNAAPVISKTYDSNTAASLTAENYALTGLLGTDEVTASGTATYNNKDVAAGKTITASNFMLTGAQKDNYTLSTVNATTTGNITRKDLTVTAADKTKFQGTENPPLTIDYSGFAGAEDSSNLTTAPTASTTATTNSAIGNYDINVSGGVATNYNFVYVKGTLKVLPGAPTNIALTAVPLYENLPAGATAGTLSSTSENPTATYTYALVAGAGDADNNAFTIVGDQLRSTAVFDFETKATYSIRVRSTTQFGLWLDKQLNVSISDVNEVPTLAAIADQTICYTTNTQSVPLTGISAGPETSQTTTLSVSSSNENLLQTLNVNGTGATGNLSYRVKNGATGTATVTVTVKDDGGVANGGVDTYSRTFVITVNPLPIVAISADRGHVNGNSTEVSKGETVLLTATGGSTYTWSAHGSIISGQNSAVLTVRPRETTTYTVTVKNASGCSETGIYTVNVIDDLAKIKATNILTPNGDGYNDKWVVDNIDFYPNNEVKIFDKTGRLLYTKKGYDNSWDGTFNGVALTEGTYFYVIDFGTNRLKFKGFITVVREN